MIVRLAALLCLVFLTAETRGEDFDLSDAFEAESTTPKKTVTPTPKPDGGSFKPATPAPKPDSHDDDFDLIHAIGDDTGPKPTKKTEPGHGGGGGSSFGDSDLGDGSLPPDDHGGHGGHSDGEGQGEAPEKQSILAGVLSTVGVAALGAVTSFIAYQKKKLCFKGQGDDPENVNMDNQKGDPNDPQAQSTLLEK